MKKIKFSGYDLESLEKALEELENCQQSDEYDFNSLNKLAQSFGAELLTGSSGGKGSQERWIFDGLEQMSPIHRHGIFGVHVKPAGKKRFKVFGSNIKKYFCPPIRLILEYNKYQNRKREEPE